MNVIINPLYPIDDVTERALALLDPKLGFATDVEALRQMIRQLDAGQRFIITSAMNALQLQDILKTIDRDEHMNCVILVGPQSGSDITLQSLLPTNALHRANDIAD